MRTTGANAAIAEIMKSTVMSHRSRALVPSPYQSRPSISSSRSACHLMLCSADACSER